MVAAEETRDRLGGLPFVIGGISFIPLIGILFGLAAIVWSLATRKRGRGKLALLGIAGILFSVLLYGALFYFGLMQRGGVYDDLRASAAKSELNSLVLAVEGFKQMHGTYPESLESLRNSLPKDTALPIIDPTQTRMGSAPMNFYYQRVDADHYYLRGVGPDGKPLTADDVLPDVGQMPDTKSGLLIDPPK